MDSHKQTLQWQLQPAVAEPHQQVFGKRQQALWSGDAFMCELWGKARWLHCSIASIPVPPVCSSSLGTWWQNTDWIIMFPDKGILNFILMLHQHFQIHCMVQHSDKYAVQDNGLPPVCPYRRMNMLPYSRCAKKSFITCSVPSLIPYVISCGVHWQILFFNAKVIISICADCIK